MQVTASSQLFSEARYGLNAASPYGFESEREKRESSKNRPIILHRASTDDGLCLSNRRRTPGTRLQKSAFAWDWAGSPSPRTLSPLSLFCPPEIACGAPFHTHPGFARRDSISPRPITCSPYFEVYLAEVAKLQHLSNGRYKAF